MYLTNSKMHLSRDMTKPTKWLCAQRKLRSESLLSAWRNLGSIATHWVHSEDSDLTGQMSRLIWVFAGPTHILLVLSCFSILHNFFTVIQFIFCLSSVIGRPFLIYGVSGVVFHFYLIFYRNFLYANSVDPDQMPHSAASDMGLHYLPVSKKWDARHKSVKHQRDLTPTNLCSPRHRCIQCQRVLRCMCLHYRMVHHSIHLSIVLTVGHSLVGLLTHHSVGYQTEELE